MDTGCTRRTIRTSRPRVLLACSSLLLACLAGCVSVPEQPPVPGADVAWVLDGAGMLSAATGAAPMEEPSSLLHVSAEMHQFALEATRDKPSLSTETLALAAAMSGSKGLQLQYDSQATLTPEQAFEQRRANCLSYTLLFVALARDVGIPAEFNDVEVPPIWDLGDDRTMLLYRHINARVELAPPLYAVIDVSGEDYDPRFSQQIISDAEAQAQFYNNRAVEMRLQQRYADALRYQLRSLQLAPRAAYLWTNLADLYLEGDNLRAARVAVAQALSLDSSDMLSYDTAAQVYERLGDHRLAAAFEERVRDFLDENPYYHFHLALVALFRHDERLAYDETQRAIELRGDDPDPRFYVVRAVALERLGEAEQAQDSMRTAIHLNPAQQDRYRNKYERLKQQG